MSETTKLWRRVEKIRPGTLRNGKRTPATLVYAWKYERDCATSTAGQWLAAYQGLRPDEVYKLSPTRPRVERILGWS